MGIAQDILADWHASHAALLWQIDLGIDEWLLDDPINRHELADPVKPVPVVAPTTTAPVAVRRAAAPAPVIDTPKVDAVAEARASAARAGTLAELRAAIDAFTHCDLRRGARNLVFADGLPGARVLILGEAPGPDEDREGRPFVGQAGQLLDEMFEAIGLSRAAALPGDALYLTGVLPWRCLGNGEPTPGDIAMMRPFVERHIELAAPDFIVAMGNAALFALTQTRGVARLRGQWTQALGRPLLPMLHPDSLLRTPIAKREAWEDLLALEARLAQ
ncbi:MAG: uracil-DNA glycosylase [Pseudotabrizicola sp.]|uniref:uracil-DNA glycosylase n=1 Tax=Pseudotabrizicola sp. TaxID=2939647 RepID=UPI00272F4A2A|nr:uracil-DNA glycosylase [Pseudotabrizicola sp.]MDP2079935.1 uracil-DNA glycosylase [Pseudotabrizicola sp.]MDZ7575674.1 uracil-DNA glycosylase [Pseudotabrizicola sp.]